MAWPKYVGVMFYSYDEAEDLVLLLGKERIEKGFAGSGLWSNFGGKKEKTDRTDLDGAVREAYEESGGLVGSEEYIRSQIEVGGKVALRKRNVVIYMCQIEYQPNLPEIYHNVQSYVHKSLNQPLSRISKEGFYEKTHIEWTDVRYVFEHRKEHRQCFTKTLGEIVEKGLLPT